LKVVTEEAVRMSDGKPCCYSSCCCWGDPL